MDKKEMSYFYLDAFKELGNIGAGHAASSLSGLTSRSVQVSVPEVKILLLNELDDEIGGSNIVIGNITQIKDEMSEINGFIYIFFPKESAYNVVDMLLGLDLGTTNDLDEMGESAISEVCNILTSSFCDAFADFLGVSILPSPPKFCEDMSGALLDYILAVTMEEVPDDNVVVFLTRFKCVDDLGDAGCSVAVGDNSVINDKEFRFDCYLIFFPGKSMSKIIDLLVKKYEYYNNV